MRTVSRRHGGEEPNATSLVYDKTVRRLHAVSHLTAREEILRSDVPVVPYGDELVHRCVV